MTIEALTQYMLLQGPSQAVTNLEWDVIWNLNKKVIDPVSARHVALEKKDLCVGFGSVVERSELMPFFVQGQGHDYWDWNAGAA